MKTKVFALVLGILLLSAGSSVSHAVTTNITSSGLGTTLNGGVACTSSCTITGGTRPGGGSNLFHSFGLFNIGAGDTANFFNDSGLATNNILSRVTGGNPSNIFGTLQTTGFPGAHLFLINPAGVIFGSSASLNVEGSFHVSTADYVRLFDGTNNGYFYAAPAKDNLANSVLSSAPPVDFGFLTPAAFGFLSSSPAAITVDGAFLAVPPGQGISFVGGNRTFTRDDTGDTVQPGVSIIGGAYINAPSGPINVVSVASPGEVLLPSMQTAPNVNGQSFITMGAITLDGATLDASGNSTFGDGSGGAVIIRGGQLVATNGAGIFTSPDPSSTGQGGAVSVTVTDTASFTNNSFIFTGTFTPNGDSGAISITGSDVILQDSFLGTFYEGNGTTAGSAGAVTLTGTNSVSLVRSLIDTESFSTMGNSGSVRITAPTVTIVGPALPAAIDASTHNMDDPNAGNGGDIEITATNVSFTNFALIQSIADSEGTFSKGGTIRITGSESILVADGTFLRATTTSQATTGDIQLVGKHVTITGQSTLASETLAQGGSGTIKITGTEDIALESGSLISTNSANGGGTNQGPAGLIELHTQQLSISGGSLLRSQTFGSGLGGTVTVEGISSPAQSILIDGAGSGISTEAHGTGAGGNITLNASAVMVQNGGTLSAATSGTAASATGGTIMVNANQVQLNNGATIAAKSTGPANAGSISITASDSLVMQNHSAITTATTQSDGGNITIQAARLVQLTDSQITTSVQGGTGNGGNITIDPQFVTLQNSQILANAFGGNGGNILIIGGVFFADPASTISASSTLGINGTVEIQTTVSNLSESVAPLSGEFVQAAALLREGCAARFQGGNLSSFVVAGRYGLPQEPGGFLPSPLYVESAGSNRLAGALDIPSLRVGRAFAESNTTLPPLASGCSS
jgi:filamentous hemagglutinin family protein